MSPRASDSGGTAAPVVTAPRTARRARAELIALVVSALLAVASAWSMSDRVRPVDIVGLFAGGMGAGASVAGYFARRRTGARRAA